MHVSHYWYAGYFYLMSWELGYKDNVVDVCSFTKGISKNSYVSGDHKSHVLLL